jgi:transketolase
MSKKLEDKAHAIRATIIQMAHDAGEGHVQGALSCVDILVALYNGFLRDEPRDRFYFSKGHAAAALYATLAEKGIIPAEELKTYCKANSRLPSHPSKAAMPLLEISSGSLGMGLGVAAGAAYGLKLDKSDARCVVLMSDGECNEGSTWEAAMFAKANKLNNLLVIVDNNNIQSVGRHDELNGNVSLERKFNGFGWCVRSINGNSHYQLKVALEWMNKPYSSKCSPMAIIANTTGGKGVDFMQDKVLWHYRIPSDDDVTRALAQLDARPLYA